MRPVEVSAEICCNRHRWTRIYACHSRHHKPRWGQAAIDAMGVWTRTDLEPQRAQPFLNVREGQGGAGEQGREAVGVRGPEAAAACVSIPHPCSPALIL